MKVRRSVFRVGVYSRSHDSEWPWAYESENGTYLSKKYRVCSERTAATFSTPEDARIFFDQWKSKGKYRLELVESKEYVEVPDPVFPVDHPRSIIAKINNLEPSTIRQTAFFWFSGEDIGTLWSKATLKRHRIILLKYDIDIEQPPKQVLEPLPSQHDDKWYLKKPSLSVTNDKTSS